MEEHMLQLCKMDLLMQRERIKEKSKKRIKTNKEQFFHSELISLLGQQLSRDILQNTAFFLFFSFFKKEHNEPFLAERDGASSGREEENWRDVLLNHNTARSAIICMDCQNTVTNVMDKQITETEPPMLAVCVYLFVC